MVIHTLDGAIKIKALGLLLLLLVVAVVAPSSHCGGTSGCSGLGGEDIEDRTGLEALELVPTQTNFEPLIHHKGCRGVGEHMEGFVEVPVGCGGLGRPGVATRVQ